MCRTDRSFDPFAESTVDGIIAGSVEVKVSLTCCSHVEKIKLPAQRSSLLPAQRRSRQNLCWAIFFTSPFGWPSSDSSGGSSQGQNKLLQLILGSIYILKYLQSNVIG